MAEYTSIALQTVAAGGNVIFNDTAVVCNRNNIRHREGSGVFSLRGITNQCVVRYRISFGANIAIATGGTVGPISVAIATEGEALGEATAIVTPAAVGAFWNVSRSVYIEVPRGCCTSVAIRNTSDQPIDVQNANIIIERVA